MCVSICMYAEWAWACVSVCGVSVGRRKECVFPVEGERMSSVCQWTERRKKNCPWGESIPNRKNPEEAFVLFEIGRVTPFYFTEECEPLQTRAINLIHPVFYCSGLLATIPIPSFPVFFLFQHRQKSK